LPGGPLADEDETRLEFESVGAAKSVPVCVTGEDIVEKVGLEVGLDIATGRGKYK
jgi:hypothetical protein